MRFWEILWHAIRKAITMKLPRQLWRVAVALLVSIALNGVLLAIASSIASIANALLRPADALTECLAPGHGGAQVVVLFMCSVFVYTVVAWVALSLPVWWRHRQ